MLGQKRYGFTEVKASGMAIPVWKQDCRHRGAEAGMEAGLGSGSAVGALSWAEQ